MQDLYVLGHPVEHSKSPVMHNAAYAALCLDWRYGFADYADPAQAQAFINAGDWLALNVTMPYKTLAFESASHASVSARLAHGANVLVRCEGGVYADNVDGKGCVAFLQRQGVVFDGTRVAVCGTGPTSLAIMHACVRAGARSVTLFSRTAERARAVLEAYKSECAVMGDQPAAAAFSACSYDEGTQELAAAQVIIDATPLGMRPGDPAPFDTSVLSAGQAVLDVVYGHGTTALVSAAQAAGCAVFDGSGMLVAQAVETVRVISEITGLFSIPEDVDLFAIMEQAAGFRV